MADELVLYTNPRSRGRIARWMLEEVGQPYRTEILDFATTMKAPAYLAINPMGKVPALRHGDAVVTETAAICAYLADAFPRTGLAPPPGDRLRAPITVGCSSPPGRWRRRPAAEAMGFAVPPEREGMMATVQLRSSDEGASKRRCRVAITRSAGRLRRRMSTSARTSGFGLMFGTLEKRPAFQQYWQRLGARPAYARARELDEALQAKP